jgi:hypothetical protein
MCQVKTGGIYLFIYLFIEDINFNNKRWVRVGRVLCTATNTILFFSPPPFYKILKGGGGV